MDIKSIIRWFVESPTQKKFRVAKEAKALRLLIEDDKKRQAKDHPTN